MNFVTWLMIDAQTVINIDNTRLSEMCYCFPVKPIASIEIPISEFCRVDRDSTKSTILTDSTPFNQKLLP